MSMPTVFLLTFGIAVSLAGPAEAQLSPADEAELMAEIDAAETELDRLRTEKQALWEQRPLTLGQGDALALQRDAVEADVEVLRERWNTASRAYESSRIRRETAAENLQLVMGDSPRTGASASELGQWSVRAEVARDRLAEVEAEVRRLGDEALATQAAYFEADRNAAPIQDAAITAVQERTAWEPAYRAATYALHDARVALERARERARIALRKNSPPILYRVSTAEVGETGYHGEWTGGEEQAVERLRMAQYLHFELTRTIRQRQERLRRWSPIYNDAVATMERAERTYNRQYDAGPTALFAVGDWIYAWVTTAEGEEWSGPPHFPVPQAWAKTVLTAAEVTAGSTIFAKSSLDVLVNASGELFKRILTGTYWGNNPTWDINESSDWNIRGARPTYESSLVEQAVFARVTPLGIRALAEEMSAIHIDVLSRDDYEAALLAKTGLGEMGFAITNAIIAGDGSVFEARAPQLGEFALPDAVYQDLDVSRKLYEEAFANGLKGLVSDVLPRDFDEFSSEGLVKDIVKSVIIDYARKNADLALAEAELLIYIDYVLASYDVILIEVQKEFDERYLRLELAIAETLDESVIPALVAELDVARNVRTFAQRRTLGIVGNEAELILTFSRPVEVTRVTVSDRPAEVTGDGAVWRARFEPGPIWNAAPDKLNAMALLRVEAHLANFPDVTLDDPRTIQIYDVPPTDPPYHAMRLFPELSAPGVSAGRAVSVADTMNVQIEGIAYVGADAWIGFLPDGTPDLSGEPARRAAVRTFAIGNGLPRSLDIEPPPVGSYSIRLFESADGPELARSPVRVCVDEDVGTSRCLVATL